MSNDRTWPKAAAETFELAQALVQLDTTVPAGNESRAAALVAERLHPLGFAIERYKLAEGRESLIARLNPGAAQPAICLCGHLDTVPIGNQAWQHDPHGGDIADGKLWGRGSTDMKGAVAAMVTACERLAKAEYTGKVVLALCASEETGCQGAINIADRIGDVGALVIGEPTNNSVAVAHKGVLWLRLVSVGRAAHGSMPHLGKNAIQMMLSAVSQLDHISFDVVPHALLGKPTLNIGTIAGGAATNIVADRCEVTLDVRLVPGLNASDAIEAIKASLGPEIAVEITLALDAVETDPEDGWIKSVLRRVNELGVAAPDPISVSYFTDASVLQPALNFPPVAIVGPGNPALAHQVDESCSIEEIWRSSQLFEGLARDWASAAPNQEGETK